MQWDKIIGSLVASKARPALYLGVSSDELMQVGREAALRAERTWLADGGRSLDSWVWLQVRGAVGHFLSRVGRGMHDPLDWDPVCETDIERQTSIAEALEFLEAHLPTPDWQLLWDLHANGLQLSEIAKQNGILLGAAKVRAHRARNRAVTILASHGIASVNGYT